MGEFDATRGFAGTSPGQDLRRVVERLTIRDLQMIVGPAVMPLLPAVQAGDRSALEATAARILTERPLPVFSDPALRRTILRNLDSGKTDELRHRIDADPSELTAKRNWPAASGFFGLDPADAAGVPAALPVEDREVAYGLFPHQRSVVHRTIARIGSGKGRTVVHMPTGAGKTRTAMHVVARMLNEAEPCLVVWLAASRELVEQAADTFGVAWASLGNRTVSLHRFWGSFGEPPTALADGVLVAGLGKLHAWRERSPNDFQRLAARATLVVIDERDASHRFVRRRGGHDRRHDQERHQRADGRVEPHLSRPLPQILVHVHETRADQRAATMAAAATSGNR